MHRLWDTENAAAIELVTVFPTTAAGLIALLQYAVSADPDGQKWPTDLVAMTMTLTKSGATHGIIS